MGDILAHAAAGNVVQLRAPLPTLAVFLQSICLTPVGLGE